jgi:C4-dicarboxylate-specific signal transduction histidine kinase
MIQRLRALLKRGDRRLQPLDGRELVEEVLHLARTELITRRIEATVVVAPDLPRFLGDRVQLQQVLLNLILNAGEAMTATDVARRRLVVTADVEAAGDVHLSVRDFGSGIESSLMDRLFDPFVTTKADGLGLGLSISRTIIAAHGGRLWAENNHDGGATFHCLISAKNSLVDSDPPPNEALSAARTL